MAVTPDSCLALLEELPVLAVVKRELRRFQARPGSAAMMALAVLDHATAEAGGEALRLTTLAEKLQVDLSVASRQVASLIDLEAVERVIDRNDGRAKLLRITPHGQLMLEQAMHAVADGLAAQLEHWREPDLVTLVQLLGRLRSDLTGGSGHAEPRAESVGLPVRSQTTRSPDASTSHRSPRPQPAHQAPAAEHSGVPLS